jgi:fatty acid desaturase (delta-4 desaturase)
MAPDAEKLRQRRKVDDDGDEPTESVAGERVCPVNALKGDEICIDGIIYDISDFDHPGGESIKVMSGNDVTIQYKMIHPYHTQKHLEKLKRVGKVTDFTCE